MRARKSVDAKTSRTGRTGRAGDTVDAKTGTIGPRRRWHRSKNPWRLDTCHRCGKDKPVRDECWGRRNPVHASCAECRDARAHLLPQFIGKRGNYTRVRDGERIMAIVERYRQGESYEAIGQSEGVTRERIRQIIVREIGHESLGALKKAHSKNIAIARHEVKREEYLERPVNKCAVCWLPTRKQIRPDKTRVSCSPKCAKVWRIARHRLGDLEMHRDSQARWIMTHPEKVDKYTLAWAKRYYAGEARVGTKRPHPNSAASGIMGWVEERRAENARFWQETSGATQETLDGADEVAAN